jgi:hypothetical protein
MTERFIKYWNQDLILFNFLTQQNGVKKDTFSGFKL